MILYVWRESRGLDWPKAPSYQAFGVLLRWCQVSTVADNGQPTNLSVLYPFILTKRTLTLVHLALCPWPSSAPGLPWHMFQMTLVSFLGGLHQLDWVSCLPCLSFPHCPARDTVAMLVTLGTNVTLKEGGARREKNPVPWAAVPALNYIFLSCGKWKKLSPTRLSHYLKCTHAIHEDRGVHS